MKLADTLGLLALLGASYLVGRRWFDELAATDAAPAAGSAEAGPAVATADPPAPPMPPRRSTPHGLPGRSPALPGIPDDNILEAAMTQHGDVMLLVQEAIFYDLRHSGVLDA